MRVNQKLVKSKIVIDSILPLLLQKENAETCKAAVKDIVDQNRDLEKHTFYSEEHGVNCRFKTYLTMIDSGAVNKATGNTDNFKCRVCLKRMEDYR